MTEEKKPEPTPESQAAENAILDRVQWPTQVEPGRIALALEAAVEAGARRVLAERAAVQAECAKCEPGQCHQYQSELIEERDSAERDLIACREALAELHKERDAWVAERGRLEERRNEALDKLEAEQAAHENTKLDLANAESAYAALPEQLRCQVRECEFVSWAHYCEKHDTERLVEAKADAAKCVAVIEAAHEATKQLHAAACVELAKLRREQFEQPSSAYSAEERARDVGLLRSMLLYQPHTPRVACLAALDRLAAVPQQQLAPSAEIGAWLSVAGPGTEIRLSYERGAYAVRVEECDGSVPVEHIQSDTFEGALSELLALVRKEMRPHGLAATPQVEPAAIRTWQDVSKDFELGANGGALGLVPKEQSEQVEPAAVAEPREQGANVSHCSECRFWNRNGDPWEARGNEENDWEERPTTKQKCLRVLHANGNGDDSAFTDLAIVTDGSGYAASFWTAPEFGCVMFEKVKP